MEPLTHQTSSPHQADPGLMRILQISSATVVDLSAFTRWLTNMSQHSQTSSTVVFRPIHLRIYLICSDIRSFKMQQWLMS